MDTIRAQSVSPYDAPKHHGMVSFLLQGRDATPNEHFWVGLSKAPVFGFVVTLIACRQGLNVGGSVQSLGNATTTSVVQGLFAVIVLDAIFAILYMELGI